MLGLRPRCQRLGHDWFPGGEAGEFIPRQQLCLRCGTWTVLLPYGQCLGGHPLREHYDPQGELVAHLFCPGPA